MDLLAGLAPGVELQADDVPPGLWPEGPVTAVPAQLSVAEAGRMLRTGDATIRRLIRTPEVRAPGGKPASDRPDAGHVDRAGAPPPTRRRPGE